MAPNRVRYKVIDILKKERSKRKIWTNMLGRKHTPRSAADTEIHTC
jgi:hypothetical protein